MSADQRWIEPTPSELREAQEQLCSVRHAAKLLPPGTEIRVLSGTISEVRAFAAALGCEIRLAYYADGSTADGDSHEGPFVIESVREELERGVCVWTQSSRPALPGDCERADAQRRRVLGFSLPRFT